MLAERSPAIFLPCFMFRLSFNLKMRSFTISSSKRNFLNMKPLSERSCDGGTEYRLPKNNGEEEGEERAKWKSGWNARSDVMNSESDGIFLILNRWLIHIITVLFRLLNKCHCLTFQWIQWREQSKSIYCPVFRVCVLYISCTSPRIY